MNKYITLSVGACVSLSILLTANAARATTVFFEDFQDRPSVPAELPVIDTTATGSKGDVADIGRSWDNETNNVDVVADPLGPANSLVLQGNFVGSGGNGQLDGNLFEPIFYDGASISADFYLGPNGGGANDVTIRIRPLDGAGTGGLQFNVDGSVSGASNNWTVNHFGTEIWQSASWSYASTANPDEYEVALTITDIDTGDSVSETSIFAAAAGTDGNSFTEVNTLFRGNSDHYAYVDNLQVDGNVAPEPPPLPEPPLLLVHYTFDETSGGGTLVPDQSTNGYDGTLAGDATLTGPDGGIVGSALELDGDDDFLNAGDIDDMDTIGQFTVSMWFNRRIEPLTETNHGTNNVLIAQSSDGSNDNLEIGSILTDMQLYLDAQSGASSIAIPADFTEGDWHHMVFTYDRDEPVEAMMYMDGELVLEDDRWGGNLDSSAASPLTFGAARPDQDDPWGELDGFIDEVQIYSRAITSEEVEQLLNDPGSTLVGELAAQLFAGDANMDYQFDQLDLVQVQIAAKYLTGEDATWGEGDWDGAPGGAPGDPPAGDGKFNQLDIISALGPGHYLTGPYAAIAPNGEEGDDQTSIIYDPRTGEVAVNAPAGTQLTSINIDSASRIFTGDAAQNLGGSFDNDADDNIFKATFGSSFGSLSFGNVAQAGLSEELVANDLTVVGSLAGGGDLGDVDLIYVPEPSTIALLVLGLAGTLARRRRRST